MRKSIWVVAVAAVLGTSLAQAASSTGKKTMTCWTDDKGQRMCGDRVPPEYAKQERQVIDKQGRVIDTKEREKTAEEIQAEANSKALAKELEERKRKQAEYDTFLVQTYNDEKDLVAARDDRIATLDGRLRLAEKAVADNEVTVQRLRERMKQSADGGKEPDARLAKQVKDFEVSLAENQSAVALLKAEREKITRKFDEDITRWRALKAGD